MRKLLVIISVLAFAGCYNDKADKLYPKPAGGGCDTANIKFQADIAPILNNNCALSTCHDAVTPSSGYNFTTYAGARLAADNGRLLGAINHLPGFSMMPKGVAKLDNCSINKITRWVNEGSPNN